jgi:hypothetical protein
MNPMRHQHIIIAVVALALAVTLGLGCTATGIGTPIGSRQVTPTATATRTRIPRNSIDFNATALAATIQADGGYIVTSTPLPVWPTDTPLPFNQVSFLATINAQFAQATETALALATPTFTPSPTHTSTPPPPRFLPPAGGSAPHNP